MIQLQGQMDKGRLIVESLSHDGHTMWKSRFQISHCLQLAYILQSASERLINDSSDTQKILSEIRSIIFPPEYESSFS